MSKRISLLLAVLLAACNQAPVLPTETPTLTSSATSAVTPSPTPWPIVTLPPAAIEGSFFTTISVDELRAAGVSEHELCENAGTFTFTFVEGEWTSHQDTAPNCTTPLHPDGAGEFALEANQIHFYDPGTFGCDLRYVYQANLTDTGIIFTLVQDNDCLPRTLVFTLHPWTRK